VKGQIDEPGKAPTTPAPWVWVAYGLSSGAPSCAGSTVVVAAGQEAEQHAREHHDAAGVLDAPAPVDGEHQAEEEPEPERIFASTFMDGHLVSGDRVGCRMVAVGRGWWPGWL